MSFLDTSRLIPPYTPELIPVPTRPANPPVANTGGSETQDSTSSSSGSLAQDAQEAVSVSDLTSTNVPGSTSRRSQAQVAAALVDINGANPFTVENYQLSVPPNLATASALLSQLSSLVTGKTVAMNAAFQMLSADTALALTSE